MPTEKKTITTASARGQERQLTASRNGHSLLNCNIFSPDSNWIVYDLRSQDSNFDGDRIEKINIHTKEVVLLYKAANDAKVGAASYHPFENKVAFIHGPEFPATYSYSASRRYGALVDEHQPLQAAVIDARDVTPPFTAGALRGGSHVHVFHPDASMLSFTYEDDVLAPFTQETAEQEMNIRNIGVTLCHKKVCVQPGERNLDGCFSVIVSRTNANAQPGSDDILKAFEEGWIGRNGYIKKDGRRQKKALACQGIVRDENGREISEVFRIDLPEDLTVPGASGPLEGTTKKRPQPPHGVRQTRLTFSAARKYPGIQGPRHWLRSSPDGSKIAYMAKDEEGFAQIWVVPTIGGEPTQVTKHPFSIQTSFSWSPDGRSLAYAADNSLFLTSLVDGSSTRLTPKSCAEDAILPLWVVFSPDGQKLGYLRNVRFDEHSKERYPQIFCFQIE